MCPHSRREFLGLATDGTDRLGRRGPGRQGRAKDPWISTNSSSTWPLRQEEARRGTFRDHRVAGRPPARSNPRCARHLSVCSTDSPRKNRHSAGPGKRGQSKVTITLSKSSCFESSPGYFVPALLYKPRKGSTPRPGVLSPCGHSSDRQGRGCLSDLAHQSGKARLRRLDLRSGRPGRAQPVLGRRETDGHAST